MSKHWIAISWLSVVLIAVTCCPVRAWNDRGHMLIALLAYRKLEPPQRATVDGILEQHPHYRLFLQSQRPSSVAAAEWAFMKAATWPDFVRSADHRATYHRSRWHYINLPFTLDKESAYLTGPKFETPTINVLFAIDECRDLLKDEYPSAERKAIHLAWLEHLIGDIHQPLHCATLVHRSYPRGDLGGNLLAVRNHSGVKRLHGYWDDALGADTSYESIAAVADELTADASLAAVAFPELRQHKTPQSWSEEGYALALEYVYLHGNLPIADYESFDRKQLAADQIPLLPGEYEDHARELARRRAALAGHRLAASITEALSSN